MLKFVKIIKKLILILLFYIDLKLGKTYLFNINYYYYNNNQNNYVFLVHLDEILSILTLIYTNK